jgi:glutamate 5-kinase
VNAEQTIDRAALFAGIKRVVIKLGTRMVIDTDRTVAEKRLQRFAAEIAQIQAGGIDVVIVTSGAVGVGMGVLGLTERPKQVPRLQATAAVGQNRLMHYYDRIFGQHNRKVGQVLLTADDLRNRKSYVHVRNTLLTLLDMHVTPIINENDSVGVDELKPVAGAQGLKVRFGDNDTLSAQIANLVGADLLIILTDIDGLYTADPKTDRNARLLHTVFEVTEKEEGMAGKKGSAVSTGGMKTKLRAAGIVSRSGEMTVVVNGFKESLVDVVAGKKIGTLFLPSGGKMASRKRWIAFTSECKGEIVVDKGAREALVKKGRSLLPSGIVEVLGEFEENDYVAIQDTDGEVFAKGRIGYGSGELRRIAGKKTAEIEKILGHKKCDEAVHRDHLVIL